MARFVRDEKRTFPFTWLLIGGFFFFSSAWALYAELVTRVPWQEHQQRFFELELDLAKKALTKATRDWEEASSKDPLKGQLARLAQLDEEMSGGEYKAALDQLVALNTAFTDAETQKTFGGSDLDEGYYYRNLSEYARDEKMVNVRHLSEAAYPGDQAKIAALNSAYADSPADVKQADTSDAIHHLDTLIKRADARAKGVQGLIDGGGYADNPDIVAALRASKASELEVKSKVAVEKKAQKRIDSALARMTEVDGPSDPPVRQTDPTKLAAAQQAARTQVCKGKEDSTRNCLKWLALGPTDAEKKSLELAVNRAQRSLKDAELRLDKAQALAKPEFDLGDVTGSIVGPYQIRQVVTHWMDFKRDVDIEQVDRCHTCHMGVDKPQYTATNIPLAYRTHPRRALLLQAHPIARFGCTACHQGQGRATDELAHSGWELEEKHGKQRWHFAGDHYWEDPLLPVGKLVEIVIDDINDDFEVHIKGKKNSKKAVKIPHATYADETDLYGAIKDALAAAVPAEVAESYVPVARKIDNRVSVGLEQKDPDATLAPKARPRVRFFFTDVGVAKLLGFGATRSLVSKTKILYTASGPPVQPVRADNAAAQGKRIDAIAKGSSKLEEYSYVPPRGEAGLQIPDRQRNTFIQALPEIESGCLRCHSADPDLRSRRSQSKHVADKLAYEKAEVLRATDPAAYRETHRSDALPHVDPAPKEVESLAPTLDQGRALFQQLNCTGCHLLDGFASSRNAGPSLDNISAKVSPEWLLTWIRDPRGWRAKTSMPNLWPKPLDPASKLPYAETSPEYVKWKEAMTSETINIAAFLYDRSENPKTRPGTTTETPLREAKVARYADVPGANAADGEKLFKALGCQGCHAVAESGNEIPDAWRKRERDLAPTLANIGAKTSADWIAYWVDEPTRYWSHTRMPDLRLSRVEAASIGKWLATLTSEPLHSAAVTDAEVQIIADPTRRQQTIADCTVAPGTAMTRVECGERLIAERGCFGCHEISGSSALSLIGPELNGFAKKDVTTLDFGYAIADHHLQTMETFASLKLDAPRIYGRDRIALKMGDFDMSADEIRALTVFLKGTVPARPSEKFDPMKQPGRSAAVEGRQLVEDYNCRGCHIIEGRGADIDGWRVSQLTQDPQRRAPFLDGEGARVQPEWLFDFLRHPGENGIRPWLHPEWVWDDEVPIDKKALRMPTFNLSPEQWAAVVRYFATWDEQSYPFQVPQVRDLSTEQKLYTLTHMNSAQAGNCLSCHFHGEFPVARGKADLSKMAPNFDLVRERLRPAWVKQWLLLPANYLPYTKMTPFWATKDRPANAAMWPKQPDPFLSPPAKNWDQVGSFGAGLSGEQQVELVRDFLFGLPDDVVFPKPGQEATSALVDPNAAATDAVSDESEDEEPGPEAAAPAPADGAAPG